MRSRGDSYMDFWGKRLPGGDNSKGPIWPRGAAPVTQAAPEGKRIRPRRGHGHWFSMRRTRYSWPLNNTGLNCAGPFTWEFFPCMSPHTIVLHNWRLAKSRDGEPQTWRTYTVIHRFPTMLRTGAPTSGLFKGHNCSCLSGFQKICLGMTYSMASITSSP